MQQEHELTLPSTNMEDQTDVGMAREDRGQMTSTECQVNTLNSSGFVLVLLHPVTTKFLKKLPRKEASPTPQVSSYPPSPTDRHTQTSNLLKNRYIFLAFDYKLPVVKLSWYLSNNIVMIRNKSFLDLIYCLFFVCFCCCVYRYP